MSGRYVPTVLRFDKLSLIAKEQGMSLRRSRHTEKTYATSTNVHWQTQKRFVLSRTDWVDHKEYMVFRLLADVAKALLA